MNQPHRIILALKNKKHGGFSLIELLVAISIFLILSTTLLFNYNGMNLRLTLDMLAHQTAQWVRETQLCDPRSKPVALDSHCPGRSR